MLEVSPQKVRFLVLKGRQLQAKEVDPLAAADPTSAADEDFPEVLLDDQEEDPVREEILAALTAMNETELADTVALMWLGREDIDTDDWEDVVEEARETLTPNTSAQLLEIPLFPHYLEQGLDAMGYSCDDLEDDLWGADPADLPDR